MKSSGRIIKGLICIINLYYTITRANLMLDNWIADNFEKIIELVLKRGHFGHQHSSNKFIY